MGSRTKGANKRVVVQKGRAAGKSTDTIATPERARRKPRPRAARTAPPPLIRSGDTLTTLTPRDERALAVGRELLDQRERQQLGGATAVRARGDGDDAQHSAAPAPAPLFDRILDDIYNVHVRVVEQRQRVEKFADAALGPSPETGDGDKRDQASGKVYEAAERLQDLHGAVTELRNQIDRLVLL